MGDEGLPLILFILSVVRLSQAHLSMATLRTVILGETTSNVTGASNGESSTNLLNDRIDLMAATTLLGFTYGIITILYFMTICSLFKKLLRRNVRTGSHPNALSRSRTEWRKILFYIIYTSVLFVLATLFTAGNSQNAIVAYVDNRLYPGGPYQYYITYMTGQNVMVMIDVASLIILWMTDALILCRFIVFYYNATYAKWFIPLPCAMYVGVIVLSTLVLQGEASLGKIFYLSENLLLSYYTLSFSLNVITTVLIAARLYLHKVQLERIFGPRTESPYMGIVTLLIESAALYGTWSLVFLILSIQQSPGQTIVLATMSHIQVIAPLLIILWIARGKAWHSGKTYGEDGEDRTADQQSWTGAGRLSFGSRPTRVTGEFDVHSSTSPNSPWSADAVGGGGGGAKLRGDNVSAIELGLCGSGPSSIVDVKA